MGSAKGEERSELGQGKNEGGRSKSKQQRVTANLYRPIRYCNLHVDPLCCFLQRKDADTWKLSSDRAVVLSSSVVATMSGASDAWHVSPAKQNNAAQESSAFRRPADAAAPPDITTSLYNSHGKLAAVAVDVEDSMSSSDRCVVKKSQKRSRSPSGLDATAETQGKFPRTNPSQRLFGSISSLTAADGFSRDESVYNDSRQQFSPADNRRQIEEFPNHARSLIPLCHDYQSSADGLRNVEWLPQGDVAGVPTVASVASASETSQPCSLISPVAASPYLPFLTSAPSNSISSLYYPNPYNIMLPAPPLAYQQTTPQFPCGWMSSAVGTRPSPSKLVAEHTLQLESQQLHRAPPMSAAFDFPWMRGNPMHERHATKQSFGFDQHVLMRNVSNLGSALVSDGLDMYRQQPCGLPSIASPMLLDSQHTPYFGIYPPLFHPPYLGIPSR